MSVESTNFRAHRVVLASVSPYFDSLLRFNRITKEKICLRYGNVAAFESLLNFMYSGQITIDRSNVIDLFKYANELMIIRLKAYCVDHLQRFLDTANCVTVKDLSEKYEISKLATKATNFFEENLNAVLDENPDVLEWNETELFDTISKYEESISIQPNTYFSLIIRWTNHKAEQRERFFESLFKNMVAVGELNIEKVEQMIDHNPFFRQNERCLFVVLNELRANNKLNPKYEQNYATLHEKFGSRADEELMEDEAANSSEESSLMMEDLENEDNPTASERPADGAERPSLKLKISLKAASGVEVDKLRAFAKEKRRRGRPRRHPLVQMPPDDEGEERFYNFDDTAAPATFDEADEENPDEVEAAEGEEADEDADQVELQCEHCMYQSRTAARMKRHTIVAHSKNVLYVCNICKFECKWNRLFYDHMREHFPGPPFKCDSCAYVVDRMHVLLSHRLIHSNEKPYKCTECSFQTRTKSNLIVHHRVHSGVRPFKCGECNKSFAIKSTLNQHKAAHLELRPFACDQCDFSTKYQSHLISHRRIHNGDLFRCQEPGCDYTSPKKSQLAAHLRTHLAVRPHVCKTCNRSFIERSHLVRHERIHLTEKPFKCVQCDYSSSRRDKLKEHVLKHHNTKTRSKHYRHNNRRARELAELTAKAKRRPPPANQENTFRPIRAENFEPQTTQRPQSENASYEFNIAAECPPQQQAVHGIQRQHSAPIDVAMQLGPPCPQPTAPPPPHPTALHLQHSAFDHIPQQPTTILHRPHTVIDARQNTFVNPMGYAPPGSAVPNLGGGMYETMMSGDPNQGVPAAQMADASGHHQYVIQNPIPEEEMGTYADQMDDGGDDFEPEIAAASLVHQQHHLSMDGGGNPQQTGENQRPMSLPPYGNPQQQTPMQQMFQQQQNAWWG